MTTGDDFLGNCVHFDDDDDDDNDTNTSRIF